MAKDILENKLERYEQREKALKEIENK